MHTNLLSELEGEFAQEKKKKFPYSFINSKNPFNLSDKVEKFSYPQCLLPINGTWIVIV